MKKGLILPYHTVIIKCGNATEDTALKCLNSEFNLRYLSEDLSDYMDNSENVMFVTEQTLQYITNKTVCSVNLNGRHTVIFHLYDEIFLVYLDELDVKINQLSKQIKCFDNLFVPLHEEQDILRFDAKKPQYFVNCCSSDNPSDNNKIALLCAYYDTQSNETVINNYPFTKEGINNCLELCFNEGILSSY